MALFDEQEIDRRVMRRRDEDRATLGLFADGKAEWLRWGVGIVLAILMGWAGAQARMAALDAREQSHFEEVLRRLDQIQRSQERLEDRVLGRAASTRGAQ